jgi:hypothetical protein
VTRKRDRKRVLKGTERDREGASLAQQIGTRLKNHWIFVFIGLVVLVAKLLPTDTGSQKLTALNERQRLIQEQLDQESDPRKRLRLQRELTALQNKAEELVRKFSLDDTRTVELPADGEVGREVAMDREAPARDVLGAPSPPRQGTGAAEEPVGSTPTPPLAPSGGQADTPVPPITPDSGDPPAGPIHLAQAPDPEPTALAPHVTSWLHDGRFRITLTTTGSEPHHEHLAEIVQDLLPGE